MQSKLFKNVALPALLAAVIIVGALIRFNIFTVPYSLQLFAVTLAYFVGGPKRGTAAVAVYVALGLLGLPVFTAGGGIGYVLTPTFGYIAGFLLAAAVGGIIRGKNPNYLRFLLAGLAGNAIIYLFGSIWFYVIMNFYVGTPYGVWQIITVCVLPFILTDAAAVALAALIALRLKKAGFMF